MLRLQFDLFGKVAANSLGDNQAGDGQTGEWMHCTYLRVSSGARLGPLGSERHLPGWHVRDGEDLGYHLYSQPLPSLPPSQFYRWKTEFPGRDPPKGHDTSKEEAEELTLNTETEFHRLPIGRAEASV